MKINKLSWAVAYKMDKRTQDDGTTKVVTVAKFNTAEQFAILSEIRRHVSRHYAGIKVEPRGFYSSIYIYYNN